MQSVKDKMSSLLISTYALESMLYYTAGLEDEFDNQDLSMESAITKYYSLNTLMKSASYSMEFMGSKSLLGGEKTDFFFRIASELFTQGEPIESLRSFIGLSGLQHAGVIIYFLFNPIVINEFIQYSCIKFAVLRLQYSNIFE